MRLYATLKKTDELLALYRRRDFDELTRFTVTLLAAVAGRQAGLTRTSTVTQSGARTQTGATTQTGTGTKDPTTTSQVAAALRAVAAPSLDWRAAFVTDEDRGAADKSGEIVPDDLLIAYEVAGSDLSGAFLKLVNDNLNVPLDANGNAFLGAGTDPGGSVADHWCPGNANFGVFGHRRHARRTIRAHALVEQALLGQTVNVVIIDEGLDKGRIPAKNWGGGLDHYIDTELVQPAGAAPRTSHGMMIARSILDLAPQARLYDVPAVPLNAQPLPVFVSSMQAAYASLIPEILLRRTQPRWSGPWVLVNAWGIFDTSADPSGSYTKNLEIHGHPMINLITGAVQDHHLDIIFAAGNCGAYCPSQRCGGRDRGPGHSIWGPTPIRW